MAIKEREIRGERGFSLVELLILLGIMAVLLVAAIPTLQGYASNRSLKSATQDLAGDFYLCKEKAIAENRQYRISLNTGAESYTIEQPPGTVIQTKTSKAFGNDIDIQSAAPTAYTFQPRGTVTMGNIVLSNGRNSSVTIVINIAGRCSVQFQMQ